MSTDVKNITKKTDISEKLSALHSLFFILMFGMDLARSIIIILVDITNATTRQKRDDRSYPREEERDPGGDCLDANWPFWVSTGSADESNCTHYNGCVYKLL
jgi:hypothetical protein